MVSGGEQDELWRLREEKARLKVLLTVMIHKKQTHGLKQDGWSLLQRNTQEECGVCRIGREFHLARRIADVILSNGFKRPLCAL
jgi:hypothetical protein